MMPMTMTMGGRESAEGRSKCPDCGNHSDKDCRRSKGFLCQIHVDSTPVSAHSRRRCHQKHQQNCRTPLRKPFSSPGEAKLPGELTAVAVFRCLRLRSRQDGGDKDDELAYQTSMSIGGRRFKGILYDQGPEGCFEPAAGASVGLLPTYLPPPFSAARFLAPGEGTDFTN